MKYHPRGNVHIPGVVTQLVRGQPQTGSGVEKQTTGSWVGKQATGSGVGQQATGSGVGQQATGSGVGQATGSGVGSSRWTVGWVAGLFNSCMSLTPYESCSIARNKDTKLSEQIPTKLISMHAENGLGNLFKDSDDVVFIERRRLHVGKDNRTMQDLVPSSDLLSSRDFVPSRDLVRSRDLVPS